MIVHGIGEGFDAEGTLAFGRMKNMKMMMVTLKTMIVMVMVAVVLMMMVDKVMMVMMKKKGAHRTVAAGTVSPRRETETSDTNCDFVKPNREKKILGEFNKLFFFGTGKKNKLKICLRQPILLFIFKNNCS